MPSSNHDLYSPCPTPQPWFPLSPRTVPSEASTEIYDEECGAEESLIDLTPRVFPSLEYTSPDHLVLLIRRAGARLNRLVYKSMGTGDLTGPRDDERNTQSETEVNEQFHDGRIPPSALTNQRLHQLLELVDSDATRTEKGKAKLNTSPVQQTLEGLRAKRSKDQHSAPAVNPPVISAPIQLRRPSPPPPPTPSPITSLDSPIHVSPPKSNGRPPWSAAEIAYIHTLLERAPRARCADIHKAYAAHFKGTGVARRTVKALESLICKNEGLREVRGLGPLGGGERVDRSDGAGPARESQEIGRIEEGADYRDGEEEEEHGDGDTTISISAETLPNATNPSRAQRVTFWDTVLQTDPPKRHSESSQHRLQRPLQQLPADYEDSSMDVDSSDCQEQAQHYQQRQGRLAEEDLEGARILASLAGFAL